MQFETYKSLLLDSISPEMKDVNDPSPLIDAVSQADTLEELGLLATLPNAKSNNSSRMWMCFGKRVSLIFVVTRIFFGSGSGVSGGSGGAKASLYSVMGGVGVGGKWYTIPQNMSKCADEDGELKWSYVPKSRNYGILCKFELKSLVKKRGFKLDLRYVTYDREVVNIHLNGSSVKVNAVEDKNLLVVCADQVDYAQNKYEVRNGWLSFLSLSPIQIHRWIMLRLKWRGEDWIVLKLRVNGPMLQDDELGESVRVKTLVSVVSDTSGRSMFYPDSYELTKDGKTYVVRADYCEAVCYLPNGTMNWLSPGTIYDVDGKEVGIGVLEANQLQPIDEILGTTLQLAGFIDRRDDDTRNDWQLFTR